MRAVRIEQPGSARGLRLVEVDEPAPGPGEIVVDVHATALNRADWLQILGKYPVPPGTPADLPGMEYAGTVRAAGPRACRFRPGDRVMGLVPGAAFAERLVTHEREAVPVPEPVALTEAAAMPEAFFTAFDALVLQGRLGAGERVLVHAVASGVGTAAAQIVQAAARHRSSGPAATPASSSARSVPRSPRLGHRRPGRAAVRRPGAGADRRRGSGPGARPGRRAATPRSRWPVSPRAGGCCWWAPWTG